MKIVINDCFGGFSLSHQAMKRYGELIGVKLVVVGYKGLNDPKILEDDETDNYFLIAYHRNKFDPDVQDTISNCEFNRDDPLLIQIVEELGADAASGRCARLKIVEIPDDVDWEVKSYDGSEWIAEKHRTWQ